MIFRHRSSTLAGGVSIKELAEYLGHADPAFTLRVYAHLLPSSHDHARAVINDRFSHLMTATGLLAVKRQGREPEGAHGTETEQAPVTRCAELRIRESSASA